MDWGSLLFRQRALYISKTEPCVSDVYPQKSPYIRKRGLQLAKRQLQPAKRPGVTVHFCVCVYTHTNTHTHIHVNTHTHTQTHTHTHTLSLSHTHTHIYIHTYTYKQVMLETRLCNFTPTLAHTH